MSGPVGVAVVGAGDISRQYLANLTAFPDLVVRGIADLDEAAAASRAAEFGVPASGGVDAVLADLEVEIVVNLTVPAAHAEVALAAIAAGKHVWNEKPLTVDRAGGEQLLAAGEQAGVRVGCAPDTILGAGLQTARRMIERGEIGTPLTALSRFEVPGPDGWHPNPAFFYQPGGGPLLDMGPYYVAALVQAFGPVARVAATGVRSRDERVVGRGPLAGTAFGVAVPTHVAVLAQFEGGASSQSTFSFQAPSEREPLLEIAGTQATMRLPDPNHFDGEVQLMAAGKTTWTAHPVSGATDGRGIGVLDMARALRSGAPHRADGRLGLHVLDTLLAAEESITTGTFVEVASTVAVPAPLDADWDPRAATL